MGEGGEGKRDGDVLEAVAIKSLHVSIYYSGTCYRVSIDQLLFMITGTLKEQQPITLF